MQGNHCLRYAAVATSVLLVASPLRSMLRADAPAVEVPFAQPWPGAVVVPVTVNGTGPYSFLIDTGSSHTAVTERLASDLQAPRVAKTQLSSAGGDQWAAVVRIDRLATSALEFCDVLATELPPNALGNGAAIDGVLGRDVLERQSFSIDYRRRMVQWPADANDAGGVSLPMELTGPVWLVKADVGSTRLSLVPDSGATGMVVFDRGQWTCLRHQTGTVDVETVTSGTTGRAAEVCQLNIGTARFVNLGVTVLDGSQVSVAHRDGLLPLHWFDRVTFDMVRGRLLVSRAPAGRLLAFALRGTAVQTE